MNRIIDSKKCAPLVAIGTLIMVGGLIAISVMQESGISSKEITWGSPIVITSNGDFPTYAISGDGSFGNPWILSRNIDLVASGTTVGISISDVTDYFTITNCILKGDGTSRNGIELGNCEYALVRAVTFDSLEIGVNFDDMGDLVVRNSEFLATTYGINTPSTTVMGTITIQENTFEGYVAGITLRNMEMLKIFGNVFRDDSPIYGEGIKLLTFVPLLYGSDGSFINNNYFENVDGCIDLSSHEYLSIRSNHFTNVGQYGINMEECLSSDVSYNIFDNVNNPIRLRESNNDVIQLNTLNGDGSGNGIYIEDGSEVDIIDNVINSFTNGIESISTSELPFEIYENQFGSNTHAIHGRVENSFIQRNTFDGNDYGIFCDLFVNNTITDNTFVSNQAAMRTRYASTVENAITGNYFAINVQGIVADANTGVDNRIFTNNFLESPCFDLNGMISWDNGTHGNWWWDYEAQNPSATNDGVVWDTPYIVYDDGLTITALDNYPLAWANQFTDVFPIFVPQPSVILYGDDVQVAVNSFIETGTSSVSYYITNGTITTSTYSLPFISGGSYGETRPFPSLYYGIYDIIITVVDGHGTGIKLNKTFYISDVPTFTIIDPVADEYYETDFQVEVQANSMFDMSWVSCRVKFGEYTSFSTPLAYDGLSGTWKGLFSVATLLSYPQFTVGAYEFVVQGVNVFQYFAEEESIPINIGTPPASIDFISPVENSYTSISLLEIRAECTDGDGISSISYEIVRIRDDLAVDSGTLTLMINDDYGKIVDVTGYEDGQYYLTVQILDVLSNTYTESIYFNIDLEDPAMIPIRPVEGEILGLIPLELSLEVVDEDLDRVTFQVDAGGGYGTETEMLFVGGGVANIYFYDSEPLFLSSGYYTVRYTAYTNTPRGSSFLDVDFTLDVDDPVVDIDESGISGYLSVPAIDVIADCYDVTTSIDTVTFTIGNDSDPSIFSGALTFDSGMTYRANGIAISSLADGAYTLTVTAFDVTGRSSSSDAVINVDFLDPAIFPVSPLNNSFLNYDAVTLVVRVEDEDVNTAYFSIDGGSETEFDVNLAGVFSQLNKIVFSAGSHVVSFRATSNTGRQSIAEIEFTVNTDNPVITTFSFPLPGEYVTESPMSIVVSCTDSNGIDDVLLYIWNSTINQTFPAAFSGGFYSAEPDISALAEGTYSIQVYANDTGGKYSTFTSTMKVDLRDPSITNVGMPNGTVISTNVTTVYIDVHVQVIDEDIGGVNYVLYQNGSVIQSGSLVVSGIDYRRNVTIINATDGTYKIVVVASSNTGRSSSIEIFFDIDVEEPGEEPEPEPSRNIFQVIIDWFLSIIAIILGFFGLAYVIKKNRPRSMD